MSKAAADQDAEEVIHRSSKPTLNLLEGVSVTEFSSESLLPTRSRDQLVLKDLPI